MTPTERLAEMCRRRSWYHNHWESVPGEVKTLVDDVTDLFTLSSGSKRATLHDDCS